MKNFLYIPLSVLLILCLAGCGSENTSSLVRASSGKTISVVTTIFPPYDFVRQIAGDRAELTMLLSPGAESHSYEPSPQDIIRIQNADIFIYVDGESDEWVNDILDSIDTGSMEIISLLESVDVVLEETKEGMEAGIGNNNKNEAEAEHDEHVWTSPVNAIAIVKSISEAICRTDNANSDYYEERAALYIDKLSALDCQLRQVTQAAATSTVIFGDRFPFRYLADEYGLNYFAAFPGCSSETETSAATMTFLIDKVKEENIPVVFYLELSNEKVAGAICEATGAKKLLLHSCHNVTKDDFETGVTYISLMEQNIRNLEEALA